MCGVWRESCLPGALCVFFELWAVPLVRLILRIGEYAVDETQNMAEFVKKRDAEVQSGIIGISPCNLMIVLQLSRLTSAKSLGLRFLRRSIANYERLYAIHTKPGFFAKPTTNGS